MSSSTLDEAEPEAHWSVECSDEDSYFDPAVTYRTSPSGGRIWEPSGEAIVRLYEEIEANGFNKLEWQCPGRISPSQLNQDAAEGQYAELEDSLTGDSAAKSKFDFDNDFDDHDDAFGSSGGGGGGTHSSNTRQVTAKRTQAVKKSSQTNLSKVMLDIKKYQMIDQKATKSKPTTATSTSTSQPAKAPSTTLAPAVNAQSEYDEFQ